MMNTSLDVQPMLPNTEWTEQQWATFRNWIVSHLQMGPVTVTFNKKDGTERVMYCTLDHEVIPLAPLHESNTGNPVDFPKVKKENPNTVSVYDIEASAWRSFTLKNVTNVAFDL
jgi:hypothetical protein